MASVTEHYETHLAPLYVWLNGGIETALKMGANEVEDFGLPAPQGCELVDLGAGFGMHALPLSDLGWKVLAIDSSRCLLDVLEAERGRRSIRTVCDDLLNFARHVVQPPRAIVCLGDTLTHLPGTAELYALLQGSAEVLAPGGVLVATFRDYRDELLGDARFIPVRSDADRVFVCFLEYTPGHIMVHDIVQERRGDRFETRVSHYRKLRIDAAILAERLEQLGLKATIESGPRRMLRLIARKPDLDAHRI